METAFVPIFGNMPQPSEAEMLDTFDAAQQLYACKGNHHAGGPPTPRTSTSSAPPPTRAASTSTWWSCRW